jgi:RHS repeat-associated protein
MPARSVASSADPRYQLRHPLKTIDVAEIPPQVGFTGKERDAAETGYDYGVYPALGGRARYYDSWRGGFNGLDPHNDSYPNVSPYTYALDNPLLLIDPTGKDTLQFNSNGSYTGKTIQDKTGKFFGQILDKNGKIAQGFSFLDATDAKSIMTSLDANGNTKDVNDISWLSNGDQFKISGLNLNFAKTIDSYVIMNDILQKASGMPPIEFAALQSAYIPSLGLTNGSMDFVPQFKGALNSDLAVIGNTAYNNFDAGNYVWGKTMASFGFTAGEAQAAAQMYELIKHHTWDQSTDQQAIHNGVKDFGK